MVSRVFEEAYRKMQETRLEFQIEKEKKINMRRIGSSFLDLVTTVAPRESTINQLTREKIFFFY